ncbi:hypothetical protein ACIBCH_32905 [Amycolatopsis thailandensis]|uniref:hypothetical protein n=1 Tax=Amycolatopsis thailandensis TaxID=589330 RepID=UPI0037933EDE
MFETAARPPALTPTSRNPGFSGRDELLDRLSRRMGLGIAKVFPSALHGLGGVGKTRMAAEFIDRHPRDYDLVWWIAAVDHCGNALRLHRPIQPVLRDRVMAAVIGDTEINVE